MEQTKYILHLQRYAQSGDLQHTYSALRNLVSDGKIKGFNIDNSSFKIDLEHPVSIECQPSYDGTVNLILTDDKNPPRIVNSRFSKIENNKFRVINRNQTQQSNLYDETKIDLQTRLIKSTDKIPTLTLNNVISGGNLKGGTYTFYMRLADSDGNKTDFLAESGQISIYKGSYENIQSISGTLVDETTDKTIKLKATNLDRSFSQLFLYFTRETSDLNGIRTTKAYQVKSAYSIGSETEIFTLNGFEELLDISVDELNIQYNLITSAKTEAQVQNMIFFGNIEQNTLPIDDLQAISYYIQVSVRQSDDIGWVSPDNYSAKDPKKPTLCEYYNPLNLYYKLGYWPNELYRLGVVYIMQDGSLSPVFNLRGCEFTNDRNANIEYDTTYMFDETDGSLIKFDKNTMLNAPNWLDNTYGVFKNPDWKVIDYANKTVRPIYYNFNMHPWVKQELVKRGVHGYFFVRQKRIPLTLCQAYSVGIDEGCSIPMLCSKKDTTSATFIAESFLNGSRELVHDYANHVRTNSYSVGTGLLSLDAILIPELKSTFDGSEFGIFRTTNNIILSQSANKSRHYYTNAGESVDKVNYGKINMVYVDNNCPAKIINGYTFSTQVGNAEDVSQFGLFKNKSNYREDNVDIVRGLYTPFIGATTRLPYGEMYNIMQRDYNEHFLSDYFVVRGLDTSPFYAITDRYEINDLYNANDINAYRGDCYTNTVTIRMNRNFIDPEVPINETIIDRYTWKDNYKGIANMKNGAEELKDGQGDYSKINRADLNTVALGQWVTYKCLSSYNLGLRSIDRTNTDEYALMGNPRYFYPVNDISTSAPAKVQDSALLNQGYNATVGQRQNFSAPNLPYIKDLFDNRVMFSNVQTYGNFQNAYRIFQSLDYQDIERQYGAIVKLLPWGSNLLCVFEHGIGILPVNEKALLATQTGQSIHMYGAGVLQNQISVINPDFGSIWQDSIIRTPIGVYGVDTTAKKIWRVTQQNSFETISDMKIQKFLNEHIKLNELDKTVKIGLRNVKTHYNNFKGDVMFTFYNEGKSESWNICYNERMGKWITTYDWIPLCSENIDNIFYSMDRDRAVPVAKIYDNIVAEYDIKLSEHVWNIDAKKNKEGKDVYYPFDTKFIVSDKMDINKISEFKITKVVASYYDDNDKIVKYIEQYKKDGEYAPISELFALEHVEKKDEKTEKIIENYYKISTIKNDDNTSQTIFKNAFSFIGAIPVCYTIYCEYKYDNSPEYYNTTVDMIINSKSDNYSDQINKMLINGLYVHGQAGIFDDAEKINIKPSTWYDREYPFEFEFVCNDKVGMHKIFDNLVIISNKVKPNEFSYIIDGDVYDDNNDINTLKDHVLINAETIDSPDYPNKKAIKVTQKCLDIREQKRRLGNTQYVEDSWYTQIEPIRYKEGNRTKETRIRDKYVRIRVKYSGTDLAIITALKTIYTQSYA